jgi:FPC/CPF motif-containing protein YcgG
MKESESISEENPFSSRMSGYGTYDGKKLHSTYPKDSEMHNFHHGSHDYFQNLVLSPDFACRAGQAAVRGAKYVFNAYPDMTSPDVAEGVAHDLLKFNQELGTSNKTGEKLPIASFVATFNEPKSINDIEATANMYRLLGNMHKQDEAKGFGWSDSVSKDIYSPDFGFSSGEEAYFVTYLHPHAKHAARKADIPLVLFTSHNLLGQLKETGSFEKFKSHARNRQESVHPQSGDHGQIPEFPQYALMDEDPKSQQHEQIIYENLGECPFGFGEK